ncbi:LytTR family DNA-binding domain-containing protein [Inconstantimicrobium mannanitabidum]|uniref:Uncharacterized protein n=1 Tax=Inconstantimicrobium mannanitabidum TaxID=1604901 RepID=A0ACB5R6Y1_9CLOT|nr:LytTR family DNA-binding domain-containing protein [Clostridium sp. TW13]GKX64787.1 hypothetical protein rsdtw13_00450 [Clostridium sp. TW13]
MIKILTLCRDESLKQLGRIPENEEFEFINNIDNSISLPAITNWRNAILIFWDDETEKSKEKQDLSKYLNMTDTAVQVFPKKIVASRENKRFLLNIDRILYFYCDGKNIKIVIDDESTYYVDQSLNFWEKRLSKENFFRCQKGYLVNIEKVIEIVPYFNSTLALKFKAHKNIVPVGRKFVKHLKYAIGW